MRYNRNKIFYIFEQCENCNCDRCCKGCFKLTCVLLKCLLILILFFAYFFCNCLLFDTCYFCSTGRWLCCCCCSENGNCRNCADLLRKCEWKWGLNNYCNPRDSGRLCGKAILIFLYIVFLLPFLFIAYILVLFWIDLFHYCCRKNQYNYKTRNGENTIIRANVDEIWNYIGNDDYTEDFWNNNNYINLFQCQKCNYTPNNFREFIEKPKTQEKPDNSETKIIIQNNSIHFENQTQKNSILNNIVSITITNDKGEHFAISCLQNDLLSSLLKKYCDANTDYKNKNCYFIYQGRTLNLDQTIAENGIISGSEVLLEINPF